MELFNLLLAIFGGIGTLITLIAFMMDSNPPKPKKKRILLFAVAISLAFFIFPPFLTLEKEIYKSGPHFFTINESESGKVGYILVKDINKPIFTLQKVSGIPSKVNISAKALIWAQHNDQASIRIDFSNPQGCSRKGELSFSNIVLPDDPTGFLNVSKMEEKTDIITLDCEPPVNQFSIFVNPGTWALSVNSIKIIGISKVNLLIYIKNKFF